MRVIGLCSFFKISTLTGFNVFFMMKNNLEDNISIPNTGYFHLYDILAHYAVAIRNFIGNKFGRRYVGKVDRLHAQQILQTSHVNLRCA